MADASATHDELIARIAEGDRDAFALLYRQCRPDVYRFAVHMCGSAALAEDVVQDVFLAVIGDAGRYRPGRAGVVPWTTTIEKGAIGNEQPIKIVSEEWRSPELQILVLTDLNDPRAGRSTYRLLKISRLEPDAALFQIPADYTISRLPAGGRGRGRGGS
jgi:RNA polymerase sigma factor (sigma-70 family)